MYSVHVWRPAYNHTPMWCCCCCWCVFFSSLCRISCSSPVALFLFWPGVIFLFRSCRGMITCGYLTYHAFRGQFLGASGMDGWSGEELRYVNIIRVRVRKRMGGGGGRGGGEGQRLRSRPTQRMQSHWAWVEGGMRRKDTRTGLCMCPIYGPLRRALAPAPHIYSIIYNHFFFLFNSRSSYHFISRRTNFRLICKWNAHKQFFFLSFFFFILGCFFFLYYFARSLLLLTSFSGWRAVFFYLPFHPFARGSFATDEGDKMFLIMLFRLI